jgi:hypothetical protein
MDFLTLYVLRLSVTAKYDLQLLFSDESRRNDNLELEDSGFGM